MNAAAVPVEANLRFEFEIPGYLPLVYGKRTSVDVSGGVVSLPAGTFTPGLILIPPPPPTRQAVTGAGFRYGPGQFRLGGVTQAAPGEVCAGTGAANGTACHAGGGVGGAMGLAGTLQAQVIPQIVAIPFDLSRMQVGQGGAPLSPVGTGFATDPAAWSTGTAFIGTPGGGVTARGFSSPTGPHGFGTLQLVSPVYVTALGNLLPMVVTMTITSLEVPEPGAFALVAIGIGGIVALRLRS